MGTDALARRIARLEGTNAPPCEECGHTPGASVVGFEVEWADEPEDSAPEACGKCGQQLVYVVTWGDEPGEG